MADAAANRKTSRVPRDKTRENLVKQESFLMMNSYLTGAAALAPAETLTAGMLIS